MNGTNGPEEIAGFLSEELSVVTEGTGQGAGAVRAAILTHNGHAGDTVIHTFAANLNQPAWPKPLPMAQQFDAMMVRFARGCVGGGAQQFSIVILRGEGTRPTAILPCIRVGAPNITGPTGSLSTEPPTGTGAMQQGMRLLEVLAQGSFSQVSHVTSVQAGIIDKLAARLDASERASDERWRACFGLLNDQLKMNMNMQLRALGIEAARKLLPAVPALLSSVTGNDALTPLAENSLFDMLVEQPPDQLQDLIGNISEAPGGGPLAALLADHLVRAKKRKAARARDEERVMDGLPRRSYEEAERDAVGEAISALRGKPEAGHANGTNGHAAAKVERATQNVTSDDLLDTVLGTVNEAELEALTAMLAAKGAGAPKIAAALKQRHKALNERKVEV